MNGSFEVREFVENGRSPYAEWHDALDSVTAERVDRYMLRLEQGNFGAARFLCDGVFELRLDFGPGYRVYFGREGAPSSFCWAAAANDGRTPTLPQRWNGGSDTNKQNNKMITTRSYHETIVARIKRDREFARLFYAGAVEMILEGETAGALSRLRDLVNAQISFKELARQTGLGEKSLHRMLGRNGNPTASNLAAILRSIAEDLHVKPRVEVAMV
jgi:putative addiction module killer protein